MNRITREKMLSLLTRKKMILFLGVFSLFIFFQTFWLYAESSAGIGVILEYLPEKKVTRIRAVFQGTPAAKSNIKPGDEIVSIDGILADRLSFQEIGKKVLGAPGTSLNLVLRTPHSSSTRELKLIRMSQQNVSPLIMGSSSSSREPLLNESEKNELKQVVRRLKTGDQQKQLEQLMVNFRDGKISKEEFLKKVRNSF